MKVLIGYDGSECSDHAITDLARAGLPGDRTEALVLAVSDLLPLPPANPGGAGPVVLRDVERLRALVGESVDRALATAERAAARVRELFPGWSVHADARAEDAHWALVAKAAEWRADLNAALHS